MPRLSRLSTVPLAVLAISLGASMVPAPLHGQTLSPQQLEMLRNNPELVRQQLLQSGMSVDLIRRRLIRAGYDPSLLDEFLGTGPLPAEAQLNPETLAALSSLGVTQALAQGLVPVPVVVGPQMVDTTVADSLALLEEAGAAEGEEEELPLFGLDVFQRTGALFQPDLSGPVPDNYRVGPGDAMVLVVTGDVELVHELTVTRDGFIVIPQVGQIPVNNLTLGDLRTLLRQRLGRAYSGIRDGTTTFDITITRLRTNQVFVTGEVSQPSAYQLSSVATVLNAIYAAGGPTENANFRRVVVRRNGDVVTTFDLYDYLLSGNTSADIMLQQGDVVFVPVHGTRAKVGGAVLRPAEYELAPTETLRDLIVAAGGFRADAALRRISISRIVPAQQRAPGGPGRTVVDVPLDQLEDGMAPPFPIEPGDEVTVSALSEASGGYVDLEGAVYEPGRYGWHPGLHLSEIIDRAGGFTPAVYRGRAHVSRLNPIDSTRYLVNVQLPDSGAEWTTDFTLQDYDVITVYDRTEFREQRVVEIGGMVNQPGTYPYREGMTIRDLVLEAHGLRDGAYLDTAEVARLPEDRSGGLLARDFRVPMDSSYLVDGGNSTYRSLPGPRTVPANGAPEFALQPFDAVSILRQPDFELLRRVWITGEVNFPGPYALRSKVERVSDLVQRAGGLLPSAFVDGARFYRPLDSAGQVNVELAPALSDPKSRFDIVLQPGDSLDIPEFRPTVRIEGAVLSPTSVMYRDGASFDYYIENAGGYTRDADKDRVSLEYANGSRRTRSGRFLFFGGSVPDPGPGSVITVPAKDPTDRFDLRGLIADMVGIIGSITTVIIVLSRTRNN